MAVKIADTLKALSNTFPVAECVDIDVNINGTTKRLQKAIDDGEIGGGSDSTWKGTHEEWESLSTEEKGKYEVICFTDDYDGSGSDSLWKGTREEWEALSTEEKGKYEVVYFTDDYDGSGIGESDSTWQGTLEEWEALQQEEKGKYEVVYLTNDYDDSILIDDINISNKTTYSSTKIENSLDKKANSTDLTAHTSDTSIHVTTSDKTKWNKVDNKIDKTDLTSHTTDTGIHITTAERTKWNEVDNKVKKTDIVDNLTSTDTDKPLSANQGKVLKGEVDKKANDNEVIKKTAITTTIDSTSTDIQVPSAKSVYDNIIKDKLGNLDIDNTYFKADSMNIKLTHFGAYKFSNPTKGVPSDNAGDWVLINIPWNINDKSNFTTTMQYANQLLFSPRKNNVFWYRIVWNYNESSYTYTEGDYKVFSKWKKVCTTSVADVPLTTITFQKTTNYKIPPQQYCEYLVANGECEITLRVNVVSPSDIDTPVFSGLPVPYSIKYFHLACTEGTGNDHVFATIYNDGRLLLKKGTVNGLYIGSFKYKVVES